ncbi:MAG: hypothetical protein ACI4I5_05420, partial [Acutalibacteraceae bacterium]
LFQYLFFIHPTKIREEGFLFFSFCSLRNATAAFSAHFAQEVMIRFSQEKPSECGIAVQKFARTTKTLAG